MEKNVLISNVLERIQNPGPSNARRLNYALSLIVLFCILSLARRNVPIMINAFYIFAGSFTQTLDWLYVQNKKNAQITVALCFIPMIDPSLAVLVRIVTKKTVVFCIQKVFYSAKMVTNVKNLNANQYIRQAERSCVLSLVRIMNANSCIQKIGILKQIIRKMLPKRILEPRKKGMSSD